MQEQRVAIVYPNANFDTVPSLYSSAVLLSEHGYLVDIFTSVSPEFTTPSFHDGRINLRLSCPDSVCGDLARRHRAATERLQRVGPLFSLLRGCWRIARKWARLLPNLILAWRLHRRNPYRCIIGVDPEGLWEASCVARFVRVPVIYYSLELLLSRELKNRGQIRYKKREVSLSRKAEFMIVQDEERARLLAQENQIPMEKFVLVPNSPLGRGRRRPSSYWHQRFALSSDQRVVLHAGSIDQWTGIEEIVDSVRLWPENWVLVVHTRSNAESSDVVKRLRELAAPGRVFFSLQPVTRREYDMLVDGAHIGIAFYESRGDSTCTGQNIQALGLSSGKVADYLRAGLPVIVNQGVSVSELLGRERCGIAVKNGRDIGIAIAEIAQEYEEYSGRARHVFENYLDFGRAFREVIRRIDSPDEKT